MAHKDNKDKEKKDKPVQTNAGPNPMSVAAAPTPQVAPGVSLSIAQQAADRAASGQTLGQQWFNSIGGDPAQASAVANWAASQGYSLGNAWSNIVNPNRPATVQDSYVDPGGSGTYNTRFIPGTGEDGKGVWAAGPMSDAQIRAMFGTKEPSYDISAASNVNADSANTPFGPSNPSIGKDQSLARNLKIAGTSGGSIGKQELKAIAKASGKSPRKIIRSLDIVNQRLGEKDKTGINLSSGAANMLIRRASKAAPGYDNFLGLGKSAFGTGKIGRTLQGMVGTRETGGYQGKDGYIGGASPAKAPTILPRGMDLMPSGRQTVRGIGKQFSGIPTSTKGPYDGMMSTTGNDQGPPPPPSGGAGQIDTMLPETNLEKDKVSGPSISEGVANWAPGYKSARSSRKRSGPRAQGLASMKNAPTSNVLGY